ncbi:hypothetical protein GEMRC1_000457 [Eukaryota sp. GEM-RC1]
MSQTNKYICTIDQGTTSTRCIIFSLLDCSIKAVHQIEHKQYYPRSGWVEHDPLEIITNTKLCLNQAISNLYSEVPSFNAREVLAIGITNQRETLVVWDSVTGKPLYNAIVWLDTRTKGIADQLSKQHGPNALASATGLPFSTYFSGIKLKWLIENVPEVKKQIEDGTALWGTIDSWILYSLSLEKVHCTDVTNASRTLLFNIKTLTFDKELFDILEIPFKGFPEVKLSSCSSYATMAEGPLQGVNFCGILGDQQSASVGQSCIKVGSTKCTYGTGSFILKNIGNQFIQSTTGLITTIAYQFTEDEVFYALEGSIATAGSAIQFLRDNLGLFKHVSEVEPLARSVTESDCVFVPAFSGLFCPHWDTTARGTIVGMTLNTNKGHIVRSCLESVCHQVVDVIQGAMDQDTTGIGLVSCEDLRIDGGMTQNQLLCQIQSDLLKIPVKVVRNKGPGNTWKSEATALGVCLAAAVGCGYFNSIEAAVEHSQKHAEILEYLPEMSSAKREEMKNLWKKALEKAKNWA